MFRETRVRATNMSSTRTKTRQTRGADRLTDGQRERNAAMSARWVILKSLRARSKNMGAVYEFHAPDAATDE
jgi:hypothetical protein